MKAHGATLLLLWLGACGSPGRDLVVDVPDVPVIVPRYEVGAEVGRLLSADPTSSQDAEARLIALVEEPRERFLAYAASLQGERDMRLLHVLDEHHALPELTPTERLDFLLWKAARPERFYVMKAQSRLMEMAREDPAPLIARLREAGPGSDMLGVALAMSGRREAFPVLLDRYRAAPTPGERAGLAEALGILAGEERRPRATGSAAEIARDAAALEAWYRDQLERAADAAAGSEVR